MFLFLTVKSYDTIETVRSCGKIAFDVVLSVERPAIRFIRD